MTGIFLKLRTWWETADRTQRVVSVFGGVFLAVLLIGTFVLASRPKMELAYGGLAPAEQGKVVTEIQKMGIPVEFDLQGNVKVPHDKVAQVRSQLAASGMAPTSGHMTNTDRSKIGAMMPRDVEQAALNAIRESEIAQTLESLNGVATARVLLNSGGKSGFMAEDDPPSASVTITEEPGADLGGSPAKAMAAIVAKAVPGLTTRFVSIVNQDGVSLFDGQEAEGFNSQSASKLTAQANEARRIKRELMPMLERFGNGNTVVSVRVEMDFDKRTERAVLVKPKDQPVSKSSSFENMGADAARPQSGTAGVNSNTAAPTMSAGGDDKAKGYTGNQENVQFPYDTITRDTESAPGSITNASISILVNSAAEPKIDAAAVEAAIKGWVGESKLSTGGWSVNVTEAAFDKKPEQTAQKAAAAAANRDQMQQLFSLLPIIALVVVAFIVIKAVKKVSTSNNVVVRALPNGQLVAMPAGPAAMGSGPLALGTSAPVEEEWIEEPETDMAAIAAGAPAVRRKKKKRPMPEEEDDDDPVHVGRISEKVNVPLEQIKKMADGKPEAIAMLLKSWLVEERR